MTGKVMSGPGVYQAKPVTPAALVRHVKEASGIEVDDGGAEKVDLREAPQERMKDVSLDAIRKTLDAIDRG